MKAVMLALGLLMASELHAAAVSGSIGVKLTITAPCLVDGRTPQAPQIECGSQTSAQPKVTESKIAGKEINQELRLVTVEW